jgi:flagellar biosynthesis/type III secretory pathway chaperone
MASIIEELIEVLEDTTGCYENLLQMANNKTDVIIKGDVPSLQTLTDEEQSVAGRLLRLEKKRIELIEDICLVTNKKSKDMTVSSLIELIPSDKPENIKLYNVSMRMMEIVHDVKKVNDINQQLLVESLDFVNFTMNAIQSASSQNSGNGYEKKGQRYEGQTDNNFFDAKQ